MNKDELGELHKLLFSTRTDIDSAKNLMANDLNDGKNRVDLCVLLDKIGRSVLSAEYDVRDAMLSD